MKKITFVKQLAFFIALFCAVNFGFGQTTLSPGDIAITGFNSDSPKGFSFVLLTNVDATTEIKFSDEGWLASGGFRGTGEGWLTWTANSNIPCGTEIIVTELTSSLHSSNFGTAIETGAGFDLSASGDQILAYQGNELTPNFICAINFDGAGWSDATDSNTSALPTVLTNTVNAVDVGEIDNGNYNCAITSDTSLILASASNSLNWIKSNDFLTIGGCYYSCAACSGSTVTWNGAWSGTPDLTTQVIIAANYDTGNGASEVSFSACSLKVSNNAILSVADNTYVEVQNDITVDAGSSFEVQPYGAVVQIADTGTVTNNGAMSVTKKTAPMAVALEYTYWSSPVFGETIGQGLFEANANRRFRFNALNFLDATAETGNDGATVPGQDDIDDNGDDWQWVSGATVMQPGVGYASTHDPGVFAFAGQYDYSFDGLFNNGTIPVPLYRNDFESNDYNWNFIGNPYPSAIDADLFLAANSDISTDVSTTKSINGAIFLWSQNTNASATANGNQVLNFSNDDYAIINAVGTNAGGDGVLPSRFIPSGQGFFVSMSNTAPASVVSGTVMRANTDVVFNNSMRVKGATDNSQFFKNTNTKGKSNTASANKLWVNLTSDNGVFNQILVGYVNGATNADDGIAYDTTKYPSKGSALYSIIENSTKKFAIQGKAANSINEDETIQLGFKTTINVATLYTLSIAKLQGDFLTNSPIFLIDNLLNKVHDLSVCDYTFTSAVGEFNSRFEIAFTNKALSVTDVQLNTKAFKIVELQDDLVQFNTNNNLTIKAVNIYDLLGRALYQFKGENTSETYRLSNLNNTVYIAKVALSDGTVVTKKAVKK